MAAAPTPVISAFFTISGSSTVFILDDTVRGVLDNTTYTLAGDVAVDISNQVRVTSITRGRSRVLDEFQAGVATLTANNQDRIFDPQYAAGTYYGNIVPGKRVSIACAGVTIFTGLIEDWNYDYPVSTDSTAEIAVVDDLGTLASAEYDQWTATAGQLPGTRLNAILDRPEVAFGANRSFDFGTSTLAGDTKSWGSNVLNDCQLTAKADVGQFFASKDGVLTFYGRNRSVGTLASVEFRDDGTGIAYSGIAVDYGTELLFNRVSVDAPGFTKQTVTSQASYDEFGQKWRSLSISVPLDSQAQALDMANYLCNLYSSPTDRFQSVTVLLHDQTAANQVAILSLDFGSIVRVVYTPNRVGPAIDKYCRVEGIHHEMAPAMHAVTIFMSNLVDGFGGSAFILDDPIAGVLDSSYVLAF